MDLTHIVTNCWVDVVRASFVLASLVFGPIAVNELLWLWFNGSLFADVHDYLAARLTAAPPTPPAPTPTPEPATPAPATNTPTPAKDARPWWVRLLDRAPDRVCELLHCNICLRPYLCAVLLLGTVLPAVLTTYVGWMLPLIVLTWVHIARRIWEDTNWWK